MFNSIYEQVKHIVKPLPQLVWVRRTTKEMCDDCCVNMPTSYLFSS